MFRLIDRQIGQLRPGARLKVHPPVFRLPSATAASLTSRMTPRSINEAHPVLEFENNPEFENTLEFESTLEIIFSCSFCQNTLSKLYREPDGNIGLRATADSSSGPINKLWLTECAHLVCGEHFNGKGVPFHGLNQEVPRAPCPVCFIEKLDAQDKNLYFIRGLNEGEFHKSIPKSWFKAPTSIIHANGPDMDGIRFQYHSLVRYGSAIKAKLARLEMEVAVTRAQGRNAGLEIEKLKDEKASLREKVVGLEISLQAWKARQSKRLRFVDAFKVVVDELQATRQRLISLGQDVTDIDLALDTAGQPLSRAQSSMQGIFGGATSMDAILSRDWHAARGPTGEENVHKNTFRHNPITTTPLLPVPQSQQPLETPAKRKRGELSSNVEISRGPFQDESSSHRIPSREIMPPPALPFPTAARWDHAQSSPILQPYGAANPRGNISPTLLNRTTSRQNRTLIDDWPSDTISRDGFAPTTTDLDKDSTLDSLAPTRSTPNNQRPLPPYLPQHLIKPNLGQPSYPRPETTAPLLPAPTFTYLRDVVPRGTTTHGYMPYGRVLRYDDDHHELNPTYTPTHRINHRPQQRASVSAGHMLERPLTPRFNQPIARGTRINDGELDELYPRLPYPASSNYHWNNNAGISPTRARIPTLPPTTPIRVTSRLSASDGLHDNITSPFFGRESGRRRAQR